MTTERRTSPDPWEEDESRRSRVTPVTERDAPCAAAVDGVHEWARRLGPRGYVCAACGVERDDAPPGAPREEGLGGWHGPDDLKPLLVPIADLVPNPKNARRHPERNLKAIARSLAAFGQRVPLVATGGVVHIGCGRLLAAQRLGWLAMAVSDGGDLSPGQLRALALADNRTAELAEWDEEMLAETLEEMPEPLLDLTGFDEGDRKTLAEEGRLAEERAQQQAEGLHPATVTFSAEQWDVVKRAMDKVRSIEQDTTIENARALELLCADFLA